MTPASINAMSDERLRQTFSEAIAELAHALRIGLDLTTTSNGAWRMCLHRENDDGEPVVEIFSSNDRLNGALEFLRAFADWHDAAQEALADVM